MKAQLQQSERHGLDAMARFVMVGLDLGRTFCDLARNYKDDRKSERAIGRAWAALESAEKYMWKLRMEHAVFDEMTAQAERLRLELETAQEGVRSSPTFLRP